MTALATARPVAAHGRPSEAPPGWSYNPSAWGERLPVAVLALVGFAIATYLALVQYGVVNRAWEPFFGDGSEKVLRSQISEALPVRDAALGALVYLLDAAAGLVGGRSRWRTMPWVVLTLGTLVGSLGVVSVALVILQPLWFHAWCTLCLASAAVSVLMFGPTMDEVLATLQHLARVWREGGSAWGAILGRDAGGAATAGGA
jgi:uncharacterized membrane protein